MGDEWWMHVHMYAVIQLITAITYANTGPALYVCEILPTYHTILLLLSHHSHKINIAFIYIGSYLGIPRKIPICIYNQKSASLWL